MKNILLVVLIMVMSSTVIFAIKVAEDEVKRGGTIHFQNYKGRFSRRDSIEEMRKIGIYLANELKNKVEKPSYHKKYSLIHVVSEEEPDKFAADIFSIHKKARVKTIEYVRHIISGYLRENYGYSQNDADSLALYISYYNAIYRGDMDYFNSKYKKMVMNEVKANNVGISTKYFQWPGKTKILIPLTKDMLLGEAVDPFIISDDKVKAEVRKEDKNADSRKDIIKLKEKELDKRKEELDKLKKSTTLEKDTLKKDKEDLLKKKDDLAKKKDKTGLTDKIKEEEDKLKDKEKDLLDKEKALKDTDKDIKDKEKDIIDKEKDIDKEKKELFEDTDKKKLDKDPLKFKKDLEKKTKELDKREDRLRDKKYDKNIYGNKLFYLKMKSYLHEGHYNNELYMIDPESGKVLLKSTVDNICGRKYDIFSGGIVVITHSGDIGNHDSEHRLTLIARKTLKPVRRSKTNIFWRSFIEINEGHIFAINSDFDGYYLGKYDKNLKLVAKSDAKISNNTFITFFNKLIYVNGKDNKKIMVLKKNDLSKVTEIDTADLP